MVTLVIARLGVLRRGRQLHAPACLTWVKRESGWRGCLEQTLFVIQYSLFLRLSDPDGVGRCAFRPVFPAGRVQGEPADIAFSASGPAYKGQPDGL